MCVGGNPTRDTQCSGRTLNHCINQTRIRIQTAFYLQRNIKVKETCDSHGERAVTIWGRGQRLGEGGMLSIAEDQDFSLGVFETYWGST